MGGSDGTGHQGLWGGGGAQGMQGAPRVPETPTQHLGSLPLLVRTLCSWGPRGDSSGGGGDAPKVTASLHTPLHFLRFWGFKAPWGGHSTSLSPPSPAVGSGRRSARPHAYPNAAWQPHCHPAFGNLYVHLLLPCCRPDSTPNSHRGTKNPPCIAPNPPCINSNPKSPLHHPKSPLH